MNTLVLFDVDGTLTEARQPITMPVIVALRRLCKFAEIGFVSGSGMEYIKEQLWSALNDPIIRNNSHILPCNGTEYTIPVDSKNVLDFQRVYAASMQQKLGEIEFRKVMKIICKLQAQILEEEFDIPLTGNFVQNRISMINWCPIGRNADSFERKEFEALDKLYRIRNMYLEFLTKELNEQQIEVVTKLGGNTSFDIYPPGWDKTFALRHFNKEHWKFWFVGDRCGINGNDYELFTLLKDKGRSFETGSPEETVEIIDLHILKHLDHGE